MPPRLTLKLRRPDRQVVTASANLPIDANPAPAATTDGGLESTGQNDDRALIEVSFRSILASGS